MSRFSVLSFVMSPALFLVCKRTYARSARHQLSLSLTARPPVDTCTRTVNSTGACTRPNRHSKRKVNLDMCTPFNRHIFMRLSTAQALLRVLSSGSTEGLLCQVQAGFVGMNFSLVSSRGIVVWCVRRWTYRGVQKWYCGSYWRGYWKSYVWLYPALAKLDVSQRISC